MAEPLHYAPPPKAGVSNRWVLAIAAGTGVLLLTSVLLPKLFFGAPPPPPAVTAPTPRPAPARIAAAAPPATTRVAPPRAHPADQPAPRTDANSRRAHEQLLAKAGQGGIDVYFVGDSITRRWGCSDAKYAAFLANWRANFFGWNAGDFGWGADRTENILWRLDNGELDGVNPKVVVILAGTNNLGPTAGDIATVADVTRGVAAIVDRCRKKAPAATIILTGIFPRGDIPGIRPTIERINANLAKLADGGRVRFLNVNDKLADPQGRLVEGVLDARDKLHPTVKGYQVWADGLRPILMELLGPPAAEDHAPPPTGDPSAAPGAR